MTFIVTLTLALGLFSVVACLWAVSTLKGLNNPDDNRSKLQPHWILWSSVLFVIAILFFPYLFSNNKLVHLDENAHNIGDALGGIMTPFIAIVAAGLTFVAFWVQYEANQQQREDIKRERFESRFYEMLRLHRDNVSEMEIGENSKGRKALMRMFFEFKYVYFAYELWHNQRVHMGKIDTPLSKEILLSISYRTFFHGINDIDDTNFLTIYKASDKDLYRAVKIFLKGEQEKFDKEEDGGLISYDLEDETYSYKVNFAYRPFGGHESKLGHYFRHLYQMVIFVEENTREYSHEERKSYMKLIRAQLSEHEQLLLYYNAFSYGEKWFLNGLLADWRLIKNIPNNHTQFGITPKEKLGEVNKFGERIFE